MHSLWVNHTGLHDHDSITVNWTQTTTEIESSAPLWQSTQKSNHEGSSKDFCKNNKAQWLSSSRTTHWIHAACFLLMILKPALRIRWLKKTSVETCLYMRMWKHASFCFFVLEIGCCLCTGAHVVCADGRKHAKGLKCNRPAPALQRDKSTSLLEKHFSRSGTSECNQPSHFDLSPCSPAACHTVCAEHKYKRSLSKTHPLTAIFPLCEPGPCNPPSVRVGDPTYCRALVYASQMEPWIQIAN